MKISALLLCTGLLGAAGAAAAPPHSPWPGGIAVIDIPGGERPTVTAGGRRVLVLVRGVVQPSREASRSVWVTRNM